MKKTVINNVIDLLTEEVLADIGERNLPTIDPDSIDVIVQKTLDDIENQIYDNVLVRINEELESSLDNVTKWW
jgi:hypothetical protein